MDGWQDYLDWIRVGLQPFPHYATDLDYYSTDRIVDDLVDIVSKNGCLLLNIGPKADGTIPEEAKDILAYMGSWLKLNGEAVYDTRPWKIFGEGPTEVSQGHHSESNNKDSGPEDIRFTTNGDTLYATALGWPENGIFSIKSLAKGNPYDARKIQSIEFISGSNKISWKQTDNALIINTTGNRPCEAAYAFRIKFQ